MHQHMLHVSKRRNIRRRFPVLLLVLVLICAPVPDNAVKAFAPGATLYNSHPVSRRTSNQGFRSTKLYAAPAKRTAWEERWFKRYDELKAYKAKHGDCNVPHKYPPNPPLENWVRNQRTHYRYLMQTDNPYREKTKRKSSFDKYPERIKFLNDIGFEWEILGWEVTWDQRFEELVEYYEENGNCLVPQRYQGKKGSKQPLGWWVMTQRTHYQLLQEGKESLVTKERTQKLKNIGFVWNQLEATWLERLKELKAYKEKHGNCNVPQGWKENIELANWVQTQRAQCRLLREGKKSHMTEARIEILEDLGLVWNVQEATWFQRFEELKRYKEKHGDCNVPQRWEENLKLGKWVSLQRTEYRLLQEGKKSAMTKERILLLESIGFKWSLNNTRNE